MRRSKLPADPEHPVATANYRLPKVEVIVQVKGAVGRPGLYIDLEHPGHSSLPWEHKRLLVHHQDIRLERLLNPVLRANYIFVEAAKRGHVFDSEGNPIECTESWVEHLSQELPVEPLELLSWEGYLIDGREKF
jgi:hypothetical protein